MTKPLTLLGHRITRVFPLLLFFGLAFWSCSSQTQIKKTIGAKYLHERWIDIDDIESITLGMNYNDVLDSLGEPLYTELIKDTTSITYNYATKLYGVPVGWEKYKMEKPIKKNRESGAPYGDLYTINLKFKKYKLFEIKIISAKEFQLAQDLIVSNTETINPRFQWWFALIPISFWFFLILR